MMKRKDGLEQGETTTIVREVVWRVGEREVGREWCREEVGWQVGA